MMTEFERLLVLVPVVNKDKEEAKPKKKVKPETTAMGQELMKWKEKFNEK